VDQFADAGRLPGSDQIAWSIDARHNAPRGAGAIGATYVTEGLPLQVDWYIYPRSLAAWVTDASVIFDGAGLPRLDATFHGHLARREVQPPLPPAADAHRLLQVSLIPVAAKHVARRSADAARMVKFVGGADEPRAPPSEQLTVLRRLLVRYRHDAPQNVLAAYGRYLDIVEVVV
jgi:hypothetical protein